MTPYPERVTVSWGAAVSPLRKLTVAAGASLAATLILVVNFLAAPMDRIARSSGEGKAFYLVPLVLALYYACAWFVLARYRPERGAIVVQYKPPDGISPAEARYLYTLGCDGRTYVACAVELAGRGLVTIEPREDGVYLCSAVEPPRSGWSTDSTLPAEVREEERCVFYDLFQRSRLALLKPPRQELLNHIESILEMRKSAAYYDYRANFLTVGLAVMSLTAVGMARSKGLLSRMNGEIDLTVAVFLGASLFSAGMASFFWQHNRRAVLLAWRGIYYYRTLLLAGALLVIPGFFWLYMHAIAPRFAEVTVLTLLVNTFAPPFLMGYTSQGSRMMRQLLGFRQFLEATEQDRLDRLSPATEGAKPDFSLLAYAIALDIRESWGDRLGAEAMVETATDRLLESL